MKAGNPLHLTLVVLALAGMLLVPRLRRPPTSPWLFLIAVMAYALVSQTSYSDRIYGIRHQLAFFLLRAPWMGVAANPSGCPWAGKTPSTLGGG